jgi:hypothetical protein
MIYHRLFRAGKSRQNPTKADTFAVFTNSFLRNEAIFYDWGA